MLIHGSERALVGGLVVATLVSVLAASIASANGVNPPRTKGNTPVDIECKKGPSSVVSIKNAFITSADTANASREIEFAEADSGATNKLFLIDIRSLDISSVPKKGDFASAKITSARQPNRAPTEGKIRIRKDGIALFVREDESESVPLHSCRTLLVRGSGRDEAPELGGVKKN